MSMEQLAIETDTLKAAADARAASTILSAVPDKQRRAAIEQAAANIDARQEQILSANAVDVSAAQDSSAAGKLAPALLARLKLDENKLAAITAGLRQVAALPDQLGQRTLATQLDDGLILERITCPIGVIAVIFESRPDALPQIAGLCLKSNNAVILKGGSEAINTNRVLFACIKDAAVAEGYPPAALTLVESRQAIQALLSADKDIDLVIPRGSNELVRSIQANTRIPVLGHADGLCHLYVDAAADLQKAVALAVDSKAQYPAACNAVETLLVHRSVTAALLPQLLPALHAANIEIRMHRDLLAAVPETLKAVVAPAQDDDWSTEYCDLILSIKQVDSLSEAIAHINEFGSHHTDCIVSEDTDSQDIFFAQVNSAGVYCNASTRFADGFRYGFGAEVGISTGKLHPRGPVGLEGLLTYKYRLKGNGHVVADYSGPNARPFKHKAL